MHNRRRDDSRARDFKGRLTQVTFAAMPRWIGIDYGTRRIGLATCDEREEIVSPAQVLAGSGTIVADAGRVVEQTEPLRPFGFVVGLPLNMDGSRGPQAELARKFAGELRKLSGLPVEMWDERLSSFAARDLAKEIPRKRRRDKGREDALAAFVILSAFLESRRGPPSAPPAAP